MIVFLTVKDDSVLIFEANKKFCLHSSFHLILNTLLEHELRQGLTNELNASWLELKPPAIRFLGGEIELGLI